MKFLAILLSILIACGSPTTVPPTTLIDHYCTSYGNSLTKYVMFSNYPELANADFTKVNSQMLDFKTWYCSGYYIEKVDTGQNLQIYVFMSIDTPRTTFGIIEHFPMYTTTCNKIYGQVSEECVDY